VRVCVCERYTNIIYIRVFVRTRDKRLNISYTRVLAHGVLYIVLACVGVKKRRHEDDVAARDSGADVGAACGVFGKPSVNVLGDELVR